MNRLTLKQATESAREFVRSLDNCERPWRTYDLDRWLPDGWEIRTGADFCDRVTIANLRNFIRAEARPHFTSYR